MEVSGLDLAEHGEEGIICLHHSPIAVDTHDPDHIRVDEPVNPGLAEAELAV